MTTFYNEWDAKTAAWLDELQRRNLVAPGTVNTKSIKELTPDDLRSHTQVHLFAGIGGWSYALRLAGWPDDWPVWTGSCPCQPFSAAGRRKGTADDRHLWPDMLRLIGECKPPVVFGEQVASKDGREWLAGVRADLEALGYEVGCADLCAAGVGAPHIRQRLWWSAVSGTYTRGLRSQRIGTPTKESWSGQQFEGLVQAALRVSIPAGKSGGVADGVPARVVRLRGYGNAIVPQVAAEFVKAFMETQQ